MTEPVAPAIPVALRDLLDESPRPAREVEPEPEPVAPGPASTAPATDPPTPVARRVQAGDPPGPPEWLTDRVAAILERYRR